VVIPAVLRGHRKVLIDSSVWIYHFEQHPEFSPAAGRLIESLEEGLFRAVVSELTLLELTVRPLQLGRQVATHPFPEPRLSPGKPRGAIGCSGIAR
jgi:hypothetical protein